MLRVPWAELEKFTHEKGDRFILIELTEAWLFTGGGN